ncbi:MAG: hypothetical protein OXG78_15745 [Chloroflexi bacterium]|nr:hypothetical protein [Chloroflexota bacterium]
MAHEIQDRARTYAFRPVWRRMSLQLATLSLLAGISVLANEFVLPPPNAGLNRAISLGLVFVPAFLWLLWSVLSEYKFSRPRRRLIGVAVVSGLTASAIGLPLVETFFAVDRWLPLQSVFTRIIGYTVTAGVVDVGLKFVVLRYLIYPQGLRVRSDAVAYAFASAIGYSFFLNLVHVVRLEPTWDVAAMYVLANVAIQFASSLFIALGIVESYFGDAFPLVLPANLLVAALVAGVITALFPGLLSGLLSQTGNADRPLYGLGMLVASWCLSLGIAYFLYATSERREREAFGGRGDFDGI